MEWERAKSYILLFFVLLNIALAALLFVERQRYSLSPERSDAIVAIMEQNNISMDARVMRRFPPMRTMYVGGFYYDHDALKQVFFGDSNVMRLHTTRGYLLTNNDDHGELVISHGFVSYDNPYGHGGQERWISPFALTCAQIRADMFISNNWPNFELDTTVNMGEWIRFSYRQVYRGYMIHSNFIEIIVTERGIVQVEMQFGEVLEIVRDRQQIAAPDEVLLTFVQRVRGHALVDPIVVTEMDLVFFQEDGSTSHDASYRAVPFYRIFIEGGDGDPFLINAFSNEVIN